MTNKKRFGQGMVEFALVLPLFLLVVLFLFDFGRAIFIYSGMTHAVREGARFGSVSCNTTGINTKALEMATFPFNIYSDCNSQDEDGLNIVFVSGDYNFEAATPFLQNLFEDDEIVIHVESTMHREFTGE